MLCQHCNQKEATTHIKKNINGNKQEMHLCSECAAELGVMDEFRMDTIDDLFSDTFLGNLLGAGVAAMKSLAGVDRCSTCGSSLSDIINSGHIGCSDCYDKFDEKLEPSIRKIHGKTKHIGKFITYDEDASQSPKNENSVKDTAKPDTLESLKNQLQQAVKEQRFEDAAVLRDKIKDMTGENNE